MVLNQRLPALGIIHSVVESVKLVISDENISKTPAFFAGPIQRLASATDVVLIGPNRLLFTHLAGQTLHILDRPDRASDFQIVNSIITTARGLPVTNDLMSWNAKSGLVAVSNCRVPSATVYRVTETALELAFELEIDDPDPGFCHGVEISPDASTVCLVNSGGTCAVRFNRISGGQLYSFVLDGWRPKDAAYVDDVRLVIPLCDGSPTFSAGPQYGSRVALVAVDPVAQTHTILDAFDIPGAHRWRVGRWSDRLHRRSDQRRSKGVHDRRRHVALRARHHGRGAASRN